MSKMIELHPLALGSEPEVMDSAVLVVDEDRTELLRGRLWTRRTADGMWDMLGVHLHPYGGKDIPVSVHKGLIEECAVVGFLEANDARDLDLVSASDYRYGEAWALEVRVGSAVHHWSFEAAVRGESPTLFPSPAEFDEARSRVEALKLAGA